MYCRNCGKPIPDNSKFCPYCGVAITSASQSQQSFSKDQYEQNNDVNNINEGKIKLAKGWYSPEEIVKLKTFSTIQKICAIVAGISILFYFASAPLMAVIGNDASTKSPAKTFLFVFVAIYSICFAALTILSLVLVFQKRKMAVGFSTIVGFKIVNVLTVTALAILSIISLSTSSDGMFVATMVLSGFSFFTSGLNLSISTSCVIPKKMMKLAEEKIKAKC